MRLGRGCAAKKEARGMSEEFTICVETERGAALVAELLSLWENSVRASHDFLADGGVEFYRPYVEEALRSLPLLVTARRAGRAAGFMGVTSSHLDALFAAPEYFGGGAGAMLMREALARGVRSVDVNEQNARARRFYEKHGFRAVSRRETDDCGKPYPILRMELAEDD